MREIKYKYNFEENEIVNGFTFIRLDGRKRKDRAGIFLCKHCGNEFRRALWEVATAVAKSCGCRVANGEKVTKHGLTKGNIKSVEFKAWCAMRQRCSNPNDQSYHSYGGRGIKVCDRWDNDFAAFLADMGERPSNQHSLDRFPDVNGNYEPGNCRWATGSQQRKNKRDSIMITYHGKTQHLHDWCTELGVNPVVVRERIKRYKWTVEESLETPLMESRYARAEYLQSKNKFISHSFGYIQ